jgi:hypothetical protein
MKTPLSKQPRIVSLIFSKNGRKMGTSSTNSGPGSNTPLVPSWIDTYPNGESEGNSSDDSPQILPPIVMPPVADRFKYARTNFTRFARSGGQHREALKRAISGYVSSGTGGASGAARRMAPSRRAASGLLSLLRDTDTERQEALRTFNLHHLIGQPISEVLLALAELIPADGTIDDGIALTAMCEIAAEVAEEGLGSINEISPEQMKEILVMFISKSIVLRIENDVGMNAIAVPGSVEAVNEMEELLRAFVDGAVRDAIGTLELLKLEARTIGNVINRIYETAFKILEERGEEEL